MAVRVVSSLLVLAAASTAALFAAPPALALDMRTCRADRDFVCGELRVPLDRTGRAKGALSLQVAAQRSYPKKAGLLIALSGGPGQSSVSAAGSFAFSLDAVLHRYRLVVIDQRGTGGGALRCPELERLSQLDTYTPQAVLRCEKRIGPRRSFYSTPDSVADIEALRRAFGAPKVALMGISYGSWVALEYARAHPKRTERLILDSVVGPRPADAFLLDSYRSMPRVLREQCAKKRCRRATGNPLGDIAAVAKRLRRAPIRGKRIDARGRPRAVSIDDEKQLWFMISAGDVNSFAQARLPGALAAAADGDYAPLLRLKPAIEGGSTSPGDLSTGLNVTTGCLDASLPFSLTTPVAGRRALVDAALASIPADDYAPWSAESVLSASYADDCLLFPRQRRDRPATRPIPDVPALILSGRLDTRTPAENGRETAALLPRSRVIEVPGNGHDQVDSDATGCVRRGLKRWIDKERVGRPCQGKTNQIDVFPRPPRSVDALGPSKQVPGRRGRVVLAALDTARDVSFTALEAVFAGLEPRGGGLRGGRFSATDAVEGTATLHDYEYVPGVRLSGRVRLAFRRVTGTVRIDGPVRGQLRIDTRNGASGTLDGRPVRYRRERAGAAGAAAREDQIPSGLLDRASLDRRLVALGMR